MPYIRSLMIYMIISNYMEPPYNIFCCCCFFFFISHDVTDNLTITSAGLDFELTKDVSYLRGAISSDFYNFHFKSHLSCHIYEVRLYYRLVPNCLIRIYRFSKYPTQRLTLKQKVSPLLADGRYNSFALKIQYGYSPYPAWVWCVW